MTRLISILVFAAALLVLPMTAHALNDSELAARGMAIAAHECPNVQQGPGLSAYVTVGSPCMVSGNLHDVHVMLGPVCQPNDTVCPTWPTREVALVEFDCSGKYVVVVDCH